MSSLGARRGREADRRSPSLSSRHPSHHSASGSRGVHTEKAESARFSEAFQRMAEEHPCTVLDLCGLVESSLTDGIHFDVPAHAAIGAAVAGALADMD